jgi:hypothetical protein
VLLLQATQRYNEPFCTTTEVAPQLQVPAVAFQVIVVPRQVQVVPDLALAKIVASQFLQEATELIVTRAAEALQEQLLEVFSQEKVGLQTQAVVLAAIPVE